MKKTHEQEAAPEVLRRQAEVTLGERRKAGAAPPAEFDIVRLVHELEVHQIELEMQNDELRRVQGQLEESRAKYFDLYNLAPVAYMTLSADGLVLDANITAATLLGVERGQLLGRPPAQFVVREDWPDCQSHLGMLLETGEPQMCELRVAGKGGALLWVQLNASLVYDASKGGSQYRVVMTDITQRKLAEEELIKLSTHDALTGLYSRGFFVEEMERLECGRSFPVSIVVADVDDLKLTNDRDGHASGDALLKRVAHLMAAAFRAEDVVARVGGDEFAVLLPDTDAEVGTRLLARLKRIVEQYNVAHPEVPTHVSLGLGTAESRSPLAAVLKRADANMYREKRSRHEAAGSADDTRSDVAEPRQGVGAELGRGMK